MAFKFLRPNKGQNERKKTKPVSPRQATRQVRWPIRRRFFIGLLLVSTGILTVFALLAPLPTQIETLSLTLGDIPSQDILSPIDSTFQSDVLTEQQRQDAADQVSLVYSSPSPSVARNQIEELRTVLTYIDSVRADQFASSEQQFADISALQTIQLQESSINTLLDLSESAWNSVKQEAITVLEQVMRSTIREDYLEESRRSVPTLVSLSIPEELADLVTEFVTAFIAPNSLYSETLTEEQRQAAREAVEPVTRTIYANQVVVARGRVITESDLEALDQLGLLQNVTTWEDRASVIILVMINLLFVTLYFRERKDLISDPRGMLLIAILFLIFLYGARLVIPNRTVIPYLFPIAGYCLLIATLVNSRAAMVMAVPIAILAGYGLPNSLELSLYYLFSSAFGILVLSGAERITRFFWAGMAISAAGSSVILVYQLIDPASDWVGVASLIMASLFYGLAAISLTMILQYVLAHTMRLTTILHLLELSRPDHPLLKKLLRDAPGTYQHSLQIANLAEQAAEVINADALLTRIGALYHDAGKAVNPHFFIENQVPGTSNPHEQLTPLASSQIIVQHVIDGIEMAKRHRLPRRIHDFVLEHHGTSVTNYQYHRAIEEAGGDSQKVDKETFRYPGPRPQTRETALVMLADGCEARTRAERPAGEKDLKILIHDTIQSRLKSGQLDDCDLTLRELKLVEDSFIATIRGVYHPRIKYPSNAEITQPSPAPEINDPSAN